MANLSLFALNQGKGQATAILIHGSSSLSDNLHPMAVALVRAGCSVFTLDMRGHGRSGTRGDIKYIGQLEDDLSDFIATLKVLYCLDFCNQANTCLTVELFITWMPAEPD